MHGIELIVALLLASTVRAGLARAINVHNAIVLVLGGLVVGLVSGTSAPPTPTKPRGQGEPSSRASSRAENTCARRSGQNRVRTWGFLPLGTSQVQEPARK